MVALLISAPPLLLHKFPPYSYVAVKIYTLAIVCQYHLIGSVRMKEQIELLYALLHTSSIPECMQLAYKMYRLQLISIIMCHAAYQNC